jgi:hypothetical protein
MRDSHECSVDASICLRRCDTWAATGGFLDVSRATAYFGRFSGIGDVYPTAAKLIEGTTKMLSYAIESRGGIMTIEDGGQLLAKERLDAIGQVIKDYWQSFLNYTNYTAS